jgi:hypothetical protein
MCTRPVRQAHLANCGIVGGHRPPLQLSSYLSDTSRTRASRDMPRPQPLHWMGQQPRRSSEKANRVRQLRVQLKRSLIRPLGMNRKHQRLPERLKYIDRETTTFSPRGLDDPQQLLAKLLLLPRQRFKADEKVNGQATPPDDKYASDIAHVRMQRLV